MVKHAVETKLEAVSLYQNEIGTREIRARLEIKSNDLIYSWIEQFKKHGKIGLVEMVFFVCYLREFY